MDEDHMCGLGERRSLEGLRLIRAQAAESGRYGSSTSIRGVWYEVCMT
jgi:hypothetical protein